MQWHCRWGLVNGYGYLFTWWRGGSRCSVFRNFYTWAFFWLKFHGYTVLRTRYVSFHWNSCVLWLKISKTGWWIHQFKSKIIIFPIPVGCLFVLFEWIEWLMKGRVDERPDWNLFDVHLSNVSMSPPWSWSYQPTHHAICWFIYSAWLIWWCDGSFVCST